MDGMGKFIPADVINAQIKARGEALRAEKAKREANRVVEENDEFTLVEFQEELEKLHDERHGVERHYNPVSDKIVGHELSTERKEDYAFFDMPTKSEVKYAASGIRFYNSGHSAGRSKVSLLEEKIDKHSEVRIIYMEGL